MNPEPMTPPPADWAAARNLRLAARLDGIRPDATHGRGLIREGVLRRAVGLTLEAVGCESPMGASCKVEVTGGAWVDAEVVGFAGERTYLMPSAELHGLLPNARVVPVLGRGGVEVGEGLLGRVIDSDGVPLDGKGPIRAEGTVGMAGVAINPLAREPITQPLDVGVRAINALLPIGRGQRVGLFAGSGVGKSTLLGMMTRYTSADVIVVGLIGERGREVRDFVESTLGEEGLRRAVVVASPADRPPLARLHGAYRATAIAEWFRDQGLNVLLLMDSLTRFAQAQREIGLSVGEPPTTRGYPPSVFAKLPRLVERAGNAEKGGGSITAFYTVLSEGDDQQDPIADSARGVLDGHFVLSRRLAEEGHYPAIDIEASISRVMPQVVSPEHLRNAQRVKQLWSLYQQAKDLLSVGAYVPGGNAETDLAIARYAPMQHFLRQGLCESESLEQSAANLQAVLGG